ncbi:MAG TPA: plasmid pRiA4b ORF-3 family protein [Chloroflexota bacterium]|nr:plasmid pRiA4b ORF-3 family protein [Chloroflexota bacterium]
MAKQAKRTRQMGAVSGPTHVLPRVKGLVIEGGLRPLGILLQDGPDTFQPSLILWLEVETGLVRATDQVNPLESVDGGISETLDALAAALTGPFPGFPATAEAAPRSSRSHAKSQPPIPVPRAGLPELVRVGDAGLAAAARTMLAPLGVPVEQVAETPGFDEVFASFSEMMGANPDGSLPGPFDWAIDTALVGPLFAAAAGYAKRKPWKYLPDHPPIAVSLGDAGPEPGVNTVYASILGAGGEVFGVCLYYTLAGLRLHMRQGALMQAEGPQIDAAIDELRQMGLAPDDVPPAALRDIMSGFLESDFNDATEPLGVDSLICSFSPVDQCEPTYLEWLAAHGVPIPKRGMIPMLFRNAADEDEPRDLSDAETRAFTLAFTALNGFLDRYGKVLQSPLWPATPLEHAMQVTAGSATIPLETTFPAPGFDQEEEDAIAPASAAQAATLYRFQVKLSWRKTTWRRIEISGDQTLADLHFAIQAAFGWDDDHLYSFFLSGKAWDSATEYTRVPADAGERPAAEFRLAWLPLRPKQQILYIFDFGDSLQHLITVEAIVPVGVEAGAAYPRVTAGHGDNEPQYGQEE